MTIKELVEDGAFVILDTNVLLNIYHYSPEFSEYAIECMKAIKQHIILPDTVIIEFNKHQKKEFRKMKQRVENCEHETKQAIEKAKQQIISSCASLKLLNYTDIDELTEKLSDKMELVMGTLVNYFEDHAALNLIQNPWGENDQVLDLVNDLINNNQKMNSPTHEDVYHWCDEGKKRYDNKIPPGYKDADDKDGIRKYCDLIIWKEVLRYAKAQGINVIWVTDDVKTLVQDQNHLFCMHEFLSGRRKHLRLCDYSAILWH